MFPVSLSKLSTNGQLFVSSNCGTTTSPFSVAFIAVWCLANSDFAGLLDRLIEA